MIHWLFRKRAGFKLPYGGYADPLSAYRKLLVGGCDSLCDARESTNPLVSTDADEKLCSLVRDAFGLEEFNTRWGTGYTDEMALDTLNLFMEYCSKKGWTARHWPTMSPHTEGQATSLETKNSNLPSTSIGSGGGVESPPASVSE